MILQKRKWHYMICQRTLNFVFGLLLIWWGDAYGVFCIYINVLYVPEEYILCKSFISFMCMMFLKVEWIHDIHFHCIHINTQIHTPSLAMIVFIFICKLCKHRFMWETKRKAQYLIVGCLDFALVCTDTKTHILKSNSFYFIYNISLPHLSNDRRWCGRMADIKEKNCKKMIKSLFLFMNCKQESAIGFYYY